ncbi:hypothetical protein RGU12_14260 [Fredinandcohnia sp. QZ13]|uniref:hypothetical protein n=1 Tax=Fredinandcohnia sp. QZ13 TaxID=3073144 RepID=UPI0028531D2A|nr:hypothetical protein [Fredinandcohnia sp. QZ13]MDR4888674.1 hypothetical protein [Fredinandcohnia sp. QZ13]
MLKDELTKKKHVLESIDQLLSMLNKIDVQIQTEVVKHLNEEGNRNILQMKQLENEMKSLRNEFHHQKDGRVSETDKEHSYHLTLSY